MIAILRILSMESAVRGRRMAGITDSGYKEGVEYLPDHPKRQLGDRSKLGKQERRAICM